MTDMTVTTNDDGALTAVPADPDVILERAGVLATALAGLIKAQGLELAIGRSRHVEVGGWQAAGAMFGALGGEPLHAETVWSRRISRDDDVIAYESRAEIRTLAGEVVGSGESMCTSAERNWRTADEYAIRGMAETRAESRAWRRAIGWVIKLAGFNPTPAEEVSGDEPPPASAAPEPAMLPRWATALQDGAVRQVAEVLVELFKGQGVDEPATHASAIGRAVFNDCDATMPACVGRVIWDLAAHLADPTAVLKAATDRASGAADATGGPDTMTRSNGENTTSEGTTA